MSQTNHEMLERYARLYSLREQPSAETPPENAVPMEIMPPDLHDPSDDPERPPDIPEGNRFEDTPAFQLSTFYAVAVSDSGETIAIDKDDREIYEDSQLEAYANEIIESKKTRGIKGSLIYMTVEKDSYTLVAFMDNTVMQESMLILFRYTLVFGSIVIIVLFFVAVYLAHRIVKPLEESYQKQKQFVSDAGHEPKTPVSVVSANAELLSREIGENQWLASIQYENQRMGKLVGQLLELARTENVQMQTERLDLSRLVGGEALPFESAAFEKGLALNCDIADNLFVEGNSGQLKQLVSILIDNAISHSKGGKEITLILKEEHNHHKLSVTNYGDEISSEQLKHLFDRFYRTDTARTGEDKHYGIGLAIAKAIVTAHKGKITMQCHDGKVEFAVKLPSVKM